MKWLVVFLFAVAFVFIQIIPMAGSQDGGNAIPLNIVYVESESKTIHIGDGFSIDIEINASEHIYAAGFKLLFNSSIINATSATEGEFLKRGGTLTFPIIAINNSLGMIDFASTRLGTQTGMNGSGVLMTIDFTVLGIGTSHLNIVDLLLSDSDLNSVNVSEQNGSIRINRPPWIESIVISPESAYTLDALNCGFNVTDPDIGDNVKVNVTWFKNGAPWHQDDENGIVVASWANTSAQGDIDPEDTVKGDVWICRATAYDEISAVSQDSPPVTIQNSPPSINSYSPLQTLLTTRTGRALAFNHTSSDPDLGDSLMYSWRVNGTERAITQDWIFNPGLSECGDKVIDLAVTDSYEQVSRSWTLTVKLSGDVDLDRDVDIFDLAAVGLCYDQPPAGNCESADIFPLIIEGGQEGDGIINIFDLAVVGLNYGRICANS